MEMKFEHTILIVDDEEQVIKMTSRMLADIGIKSVCAKNGETGLEKILNTPKPFSLIIADQHMPGMKGHEFLEKAREMTPKSIRFLITGHRDIQDIIDAVNKGAIHLYQTKPWDNDDFMKSIAMGLKKYELVLDNERLFSLAKEQNLKLYEFHKEQNDKTKEHQIQLSILDREINALAARVEEAKNSLSRQQEISLEKIRLLLKANDLVTEEKISRFFAVTLQEFHEQFQEIITRNRFKTPDNF